MSGFLDKAKEQAGKAREQAQRGLQQGKDKLGDVQAQRHGTELLRGLGAAYYRMERGGGSGQDVEGALQALDAHIAEHGDAFLK